MTGPVINVSGVSKYYRNYRSERRRVLSWFGIPDPHVSDHYVLKDISFSVNKGESIGVLGVNGAGKSTLLKILSGTLMPGSGQVEIKGRVAAILELGMGFHPDLSGRQNVYQVGSLMGLSRSEIAAAIDDIHAFSEIGDYFEKPLRQYSSGMQVRLAFSLATAYRPDILIVDEALSVGDAYFQHKSFARIKAFQKEGTSLLLVSHDRTAIQQVCDRAILLHEGVVQSDGKPADVVDYYNALLADRAGADVTQISDEQGRTVTASGTGEAKLLSLTLHNAQGEVTEAVNVGDTVTLHAQAQINQPIERLVFGYMLRDPLGQNAFGTNTHHTDQILENLSAGQIIDYRIEFQLNLGPGNYSISTCLSDAENHMNMNYEWRDLALVFEVINAAQPIFSGTAWLPPLIEVATRHGD